MNSNNKQQQQTTASNNLLRESILGLMGGVTFSYGQPAPQLISYQGQQCIASSMEQLRKQQTI